MRDAPFYERYAGRPCAVCDGTEGALLFRQTFSELSRGSLLRGYDVTVCDRCGFGFADRIPDQSAFDAHYREMSKYEYGDRGGRETEFDLERFRAIRDGVAPYLSDARARILDVGCATGRLLALFRDEGFADVTGLDPSPECARIARELHGIRVATGAVCDAGELLGEERPFDCVLLSGVLEHVRDVKSALEQIRGLTAEKGLVFVETPDATAFARRPDAPFQEFSTEHINFFSPGALHNLMQRHGFVRIYSRRAPRPQAVGTVMPVVTALYVREDGLRRVAPTRDEETVRGLKEYVAASLETEREVRRTIEQLVECAKPIVVWGVGTHTLRLLSTSRLAQADIRAFVDSNPRYQGKTLQGISIIAPAELADRTEAILISSRVHQSVIEKQIREELRMNNELIELYRV
jgi:2-polyprenyl-3-methyl-5-hydroxy-6-metoxy-1,4-benzoquinol methylase